MSSMPQGDAPGPRGDTQESAHLGESAGVPHQGAMPGQEQGGTDPGGYQAQHGQPGAMSPVSEERTRVTGRRVVQYVIDYVLAGIIPGLAYWLLSRGHGVLLGLGWLLATAIAIAVYFWYWVARPHGNGGQTFGMQLLSLRVISKDGGQASMMQFFVRGILLIVDTLFFRLVGLIPMLCSRHRQRNGHPPPRRPLLPAPH